MTLAGEVYSTHEAEILAGEVYRKHHSCAIAEILPECQSLDQIRGWTALRVNLGPCSENPSSGQ